MYRVMPVQSKVIEKKLQNIQHEYHERRMREVKSCLDERAQGTLQNAGTTKVKQIRNYKKEQMMEARFTEIERDNRILLERMTSIMKNGRGNRPNTQQAKTQSPRKSLNNDKRKLSLMRITLENQLILKRLQ